MNIHRFNFIRFLKRIPLYIFLILLAFLFAFPFYYMIMGATQTSGESFHVPPILIPGTTFVANVQWFLGKMQGGLMFRWYLNTLGYALGGAGLEVFLATLAGFAFAKYRKAPGNNTLFSIVVGSMFLPGVMGFIPIYIMMARLKWLDTYLALIVPSLVGAFAIFWMRQFISSAIPDELLDAARIDGASEINTFIKVVMPIAIPGAMPLLIFGFLGRWNDYFWPMLMLNSSPHFTVQVGVVYLLSSAEAWINPIRFVAPLFAALPMLVVFIIASRQIISGVSTGALKDVML
jgi:cellobiose transport system permease protein